MFATEQMLLLFYSSLGIELTVTRSYASAVLRVPEGYRESSAEMVHQLTKSRPSSDVATAP